MEGIDDNQAEGCYLDRARIKVVGLVWNLIMLFQAEVHIISIISVNCFGIDRDHD
jgi:hypothetical protein